MSADTELAARFCTACGRPTGAGRFCTGCGTPLGVAPSAAAPPGATSPSSAPPSAGSSAPRSAPPSPRRSLKPLFVAAGVILVALSAGTAGLMLLRGDAGDDVAAQTPAVTVPTEPPGRTAADDPFPDSVPYRTPSYSVRVPEDWRLVADDVDHSVYQESKWRHPRSRDVAVVIDYTDGYRGTAREGAETVREQVSAASGYRERSFELVPIGGGRHAWRWEFTLGGRRKVDYFFNGCGTGFAVLGESRSHRFVMYRATFERIARSLRPAC